MQHPMIGKVSVVSRLGGGMMRLRTQLLVAGLVKILLVGGLVAIVAVERQHQSADARTLYQLADATRQARELSLYVQYNAHDTNAYTLGHLEHRQEFTEHSAEFDTLLAMLQGHVDAELLDADEREQLDEIQQTRAAYLTASERLFVAADAQRVNPSPANLSAQDAAWEASDQLGDQLDDQSQVLAQRIGDDLQRLELELADHERRFTLLVFGLGGIIILLIAGILALSTRALGRPLQHLVQGVQHITAGNYTVEVATDRKDELGVLGRAVAQLASTLQAQLGALQQREVQLQGQNQELKSLLETVRDLETPAIPLMDGVLVVPLVGHIDTRRAEHLQRGILDAVHTQQIRLMILDITGVTLIDTAVAQRIETLVRSIQLLGARVALTGIRAELAGTMVTQGIDFRDIYTPGRLQDGIAEILKDAHGAPRN
jgi:anti-anti-sigma regulatory factor/HAMP domain-containing protein